jgi:hypothetical protein
MASTLASRQRARVLYAGVAAFAVLTALTARSVWLAWQQRSGEAHAAAVYDLVGQRTALRPTDAPGAMAWLRQELDRYARSLDSERAQVYRHLASARHHVPAELVVIADTMRIAPASAPPGPIDLRSVASQGSSLRREWVTEVEGQPFVITRRPVAGDAPLGGDPFVSYVVPALNTIKTNLARELSSHPLPAVPGDRPPRPVRVYAVATDGTLVSAPWVGDGAGAQEIAARELALLAARPGLPSFAPEEFFFRFEPSNQSAGAAAYSGFYLDLGGRGLVSTVLTPAAIAGRLTGVLAVDLAFDIDWDAFAASIARPIAGVAVRVRQETAPSWSELERAIPSGADTPLREALADLASGEPQDAADESPLRHGLIDGRGAVAAFQVADSIWLLMLFPRTDPAFPMAALALLAGVLALLLAGFEFNRRKADRERRSAEGALAEKQNLLNTMQVPLVVVDPNTDAIVSSNRAAENIGIRAGGRFADLVAPDPRARQHYDRMQVATPAPRRAYGVPVVVRDEGGRSVEKYAVVRSVAVTAPIQALAADERHRLGVLFVLDPEADLALLQDEVEQRAHRDERRRLAGLLSHGVDTLARVLEHALRTTAGLKTGGATLETGGAIPKDVDGSDGREFLSWLAEYLERRLAVTAWLLDHWDATPPLPRDNVVDRDQAKATVDRLRSILEHVQRDRVLRSRLHWNNGTLSVDRDDGRVIDVTCEWPAAFEFTLPVRGGFGLFIGEAIVNAVRHGMPGTVPRVSIACDHARRELAFSVSNACPSCPDEGVRSETYGGVAILRTLARLFEWRDLEFARRNDVFEASWRVPVSQRPTAGQAD